MRLVRGLLWRAGKNKRQTLKVKKSQKKRKLTGRALKRYKYEKKILKNKNQLKSFKFFFYNKF